jgi:hypothetical protein
MPRSTSATTAAPSARARHVPPPPCNLVVLHGVVRSEPVTKALPSGDVSVTFDLRVPGPDGKVSATPVCWIGPPSKAPELLATQEVVVIGQVARRFFRTASGLASRVDVRASDIVKGSVTRRRKAIVAARALLS